MEDLYRSDGTPKERILRLARRATRAGCPCAGCWPTFWKRGGGTCDPRRTVRSGQLPDPSGGPHHAEPGDVQGLRPSCLHLLLSRPLLHLERGALPGGLRLRGLPGVRHLPAGLRPRRPRLALPAWRIWCSVPASHRTASAAGRPPAPSERAARDGGACPALGRRRRGHEDPRVPRRGGRCPHPARSATRGAGACERTGWCARSTRPAPAPSTWRSPSPPTAPTAHVTVIHLGPPEHELLLAAGPGPRLPPGDTRLGSRRPPRPALPARPLVLAAAAQAAGYDLVLTGDRGVIGAGGQLGVLVAGALGAALRHRGGRGGAVRPTPTG